VDSGKEINKPVDVGSGASTVYSVGYKRVIGGCRREWFFSGLDVYCIGSCASVV